MNVPNFFLFTSRNVTPDWSYTYIFNEGDPLGYDPELVRAIGFDGMYSLHSRLGVDYEKRTTHLVG